MRRLLFTGIPALLAFLAGAVAATAQNPIIPEAKYNSDPQARTWSMPDGTQRLYVYGSRDESSTWYCSHAYDVLSTDDMKSWKLTPDSFLSKGEGDQVPYNDEFLYAPDCFRKDGKYWLFYSQSGGRDVEGVAVSDRPEGPFRDGSAIQGANQIDPSVFIDDDGQAYLFFGQFAAKCARLNPDMRSIDRSTLRDSIITEAEHHFHEGIQAFKRNGIYYLVYADISRRGMPTCLGYATSEHVMGPYTYRGVIVDNFGCDPYVWNNHGSVGELNGQWYVFYHRSTNGTEMLRKSCVEPIRFNPDGTIDEVPMTTSGAAGYLDPFTLMPGWRACGLTGHARIVLRKQAGREILAQIRRRDSALWRDFRFDRTPERMQLTVIPHRGGKVQVFANTLCLPLVAEFDVPAGDGMRPVTLEVPVKAALEGVHPLFFRFNGEAETDLMDLVSFRFR